MTLASFTVLYNLFFKKAFRWLAGDKVQIGMVDKRRVHSMVCVRWIYVAFIKALVLLLDVRRDSIDAIIPTLAVFDGEKRLTKVWSVRSRRQQKGYYARRSRR